MILRRASVLGLVVATSLAGCGGEGPSESSSSVSAECPPKTKGSGIAVSSRVNIEDAMKYAVWQRKYPPLKCAEDLAPLIPDLPDGYGLAPSSLSRPPIMGEDHVAFSLGELPAQLMTVDDVPNVPTDTKRIDYEIVRFTAAERKTMETWFETYPDAYSTKTFEGETIYLAGAVATMRPGKGGRVGTGIIVPLDNDLLIRMSYTDMLNQLSGDGPMPPKEGNEALEFLASLIANAKSEGLL